MATKPSVSGLKPPGADRAHPSSVPKKTNLVLASLPPKLAGFGGQAALVSHGALAARAAWRGWRRGGHRGGRKLVGLGWARGRGTIDGFLESAGVVGGALRLGCPLLERNDLVCRLHFVPAPRL